MRAGVARDENGVQRALSQGQNVENHVDLNLDFRWEVFKEGHDLSSFGL